MILLVIADSLFTALAMVFAVILRLGWVGGIEYLQTRVVGIFVAWAAFMVASYIGGLYEPDRLLRLGRTLVAAVISGSLGSVLIATVFYATLSPEIGRGIFLGFAVFVFVSVVATRLIYMEAMRRGFMSQRCLIVGTNGEARKALDLVGDHPHAGLRVLGLIHSGADRDRVGKFVNGYPILGSLESLEKFVDLYAIDRLILATTIESEPLMLKRLRTFRYRGIALVDFAALYEELAHEIPIDHIDDEWLLLASMNTSQFHVRRVKRLLDMFVAVVGLALTVPLVVVTAILIKLTSRGPIFYRQERLGRDSVPFMVLKFRTMFEDAESKSGPVWAADDDPRITPIGKWLRKFRVDEIPQLLNVLRGDMSLVGPRPEREVFIKKLSEKLPFYSERLLVPPGLTGWAQVMHPYTASIEESRRKLQFDLYYIKHMSFFLDVFILVLTVKTVLFGHERAKPAQRLAQVESRTEEIETETVPFEPPAPPADQQQLG